MPINYETPGGYFDGQGQFHTNTGLLPSPVPGLSYTIPINPALPYNILPDFQPPAVALPNFGLPSVNDLLGAYGRGLGTGAVSELSKLALPAVALYVGYSFAKKRGWF